MDAPISQHLVHMRLESLTLQVEHQKLPLLLAPYSLLCIHIDTRKRGYIIHLIRLGTYGREYTKSATIKKRYS